ncbi:MAG: SpoIID/LytB domain-containing protein [Eubacterium sp.]|nr:SpoIID/LytB domain-containing protein [Eubacterium sp.]
MKKVIIGWIVLLILTATAFRIDSAELMESVQIPESEPAVKLKTLEKEKKKEDKAWVRIVILNPESKQRWHRNIKLRGTQMKIYRAKEKTEVASLDLNRDSSVFQDDRVIMVEAKDGITIEGTWDKDVVYYGTLYIYRENSGLVMVNQVELEDYVAGVVSSEIGVDAPKEAMKAQAVCARTYIVSSKIKKYKKYKAEADDSTDYQVYNRNAPNKRCFQAAKETRNLILTYQGKTITAYYFSTSCGYTTNYRIWGREKKPYLSGCKVAKKWNQPSVNFEKYIRGKGDGYEKKQPYYRWKCYLNSGQIENAVALMTGVDIGRFEKAEVNERGVGGIASQITIYGDERQVVVNNQMQIRKILCSSYMNLELQDGTIKTGLLMLPSAFIAMDTVYQGRVVSGLKIYGGGFGHGSGMSQNGAMEMAKQGCDYKQILNHFYKKIRIQKRETL